MIQVVTAYIFGFYVTLVSGLENNVCVSTEIENKKTPLEGDFFLTNIFQNAFSK